MVPKKKKRNFLLSLSDEETEEEELDVEGSQELMVVTPAKKKRKSTLTSSGTKSVASSKKKTTTTTSVAKKPASDGSVAFKPGDKVLEVEYPIQMGPRLAQTTMTQAYKDYDTDDDDDGGKKKTATTGKNGTKTNKRESHWKTKKDGLSHKLFKEHDINGDIDLPSSQPSSQSIKSYDGEDAPSDPEAVPVPGNNQADGYDSDIANVGTIIPDEHARRNDDDDNSSSGTSNAFGTQENEFTQDFSRPELKELQWSLD